MLSTVLLSYSPVFKSNRWDLAWMGLATVEAAAGATETDCPWKAISGVADAETDVKAAVPDSAVKDTDISGHRHCCKNYNKIHFSNFSFSDFFKGVKRNKNKWAGNGRGAGNSNHCCCNIARSLFGVTKPYVNKTTLAAGLFLNFLISKPFLVIKAYKLEAVIQIFRDFIKSLKDRKYPCCYYNSLRPVQK